MALPNTPSAHWLHKGRAAGQRGAEAHEEAAAGEFEDGGSEGEDAAGSEAAVAEQQQAEAHSRQLQALSAQLEASEAARAEEAEAAASRERHRHTGRAPQRPPPLDVAAAAAEAEAMAAERQGARKPSMLSHLAIIHAYARARQPAGMFEAVERLLQVGRGGRAAGRLGGRMAGANPAGHLSSHVPEPSAQVPLLGASPLPSGALCCRSTRSSARWQLTMTDCPWLWMAWRARWRTVMRHSMCWRAGPSRCVRARRCFRVLASCFLADKHLRGTAAAPHTHTHTCSTGAVPHKRCAPLQGRPVHVKQLNLVVAACCQIGDLKCAPVWLPTRPCALDGHACWLPVQPVQANAVHPARSLEVCTLPDAWLPP